MPLKSHFPDLDIPKTNVLTYFFPPNSTPSDTPVWIDAENDRNSLSPRQLLRWVKQLAVGLRKQGLRRGEVAMIFTPNHLYVPVAYLAIVGSGAIFSGSNPAYTVAELIYQMKDTESKIVLVHPSLLNTALAASKGAGVPRTKLYLFSDEVCESVDGIQDWRSMVGSVEEAERWQWDQLDSEQSCKTVATINYSSGTTGMPKGVCISHHNLIANVEQATFMRDHKMPYEPKNRPPERWVGFLPLYHAFGQQYTILMAAKLNIPVYIMKTFQYEPFLRIIQDYKITHLQTAPPILIMLSKRPETKNYDLSSIRDILCGAAPLSRQLQNDVARLLKLNVRQGWGMTEVTCGALHVPGGMDDETGSVGLQFPNVESKLLDDEGKEVGPGERGELCVRGPNICLRYWKNEQATRDSIDEEGWLRSGDVAERDEKGMFWIVDRKKELIKVNALQVAPAELEAVLLEHDDVADAAVVGITLNATELPRAYVVLKDEARGKVTETEIQMWMKKRLAKHKWLEGGVVFIDEVPKLASGKIKRKVMKDWAARDAAILDGPVKARL